MKISLIIKIIGTMHLVLGVALWGMLIFATDIVAPYDSTETVVAVQGTADVVGAHSVGIGLLLIVLSFIKDIESARLVLVGELVLMIRRPPRSTHCISSAASDVYKRQVYYQCI